MDSRMKEEWWMGSGILINENQILTNSHVVSRIVDKKYITGEAIFKGVRVPLKPRLEVDDKCDLAVVYPSSPIESPEVVFGGSDDFQKVFVVGNFLERGISLITADIIRKDLAVNFDPHTEFPKCRMFQFSATNYPGGSGGAVFKDNQVITGILQSWDPRISGIGYAIDKSEIERFLFKLP